MGNIESKFVPWLLTAPEYNTAASTTTSLRSEAPKRYRVARREPLPRAAALFVAT
jgi:hypothetical protein